MPQESAVLPFLILVTGEPGSGKTTLGLRLSDALRVPFLSRDLVRGGLLATAGLWTNQLRDPTPREAAAHAFVGLLEAAARAGITMVAEFVVTPERRTLFDRLVRATRCMVVLTESADAAPRAAVRDRADTLLNRRQVLDALGHDAIEEYLQGPERTRVAAAMQTKFDLPVLRVLTDDGYEPSFERIVDWAIDRTRT